MLSVDTEDRAVSPVIGVILMVAITVILAAVISTFVLGIGGQSETAPNVAFEFQEETGQVQQVNGTKLSSWFNGSHHPGEGTPPYHDNTTVAVVVQSGEDVDTSNLNVTVNGERAWGVVDNGAGAGTVTRPLFSSGTASAGSGGTIALYGDAMTNDTHVENSGDIPDNGATELREGDVVRVVWTSDSGETSTVLDEYTV